MTLHINDGAVFLPELPDCKLMKEDSLWLTNRLFTEQIKFSS